MVSENLYFEIRSVSPHKKSGPSGQSVTTVSFAMPKT
jgi:hypothetical protein